MVRRKRFELLTPWFVGAGFNELFLLKTSTYSAYPFYIATASNLTHMLSNVDETQKGVTPAVWPCQSVTMLCKCAAFATVE